MNDGERQRKRENERERKEERKSDAVVYGEEKRTENG